MPLTPIGLPDPNYSLPSNEIAEKIKLEFIEHIRAGHRVSLFPSLVVAASPPQSKMPIEIYQFDGPENQERDDYLPCSFCIQDKKFKNGSLIALDGFGLTIVGNDCARKHLGAQNWETAIKERKLRDSKKKVLETAAKCHAVATDFLEKRTTLLERLKAYVSHIAAFKNDMPTFASDIKRELSKTKWELVYAIETANSDFMVGRQNSTTATYGQVKGKEIFGEFKNSEFELENLSQKLNELLKQSADENFETWLIRQWEQSPQEVVDLNKKFNLTFQEINSIFETVNLGVSFLALRNLQNLERWVKSGSLPVQFGLSISTNSEVRYKSERFILPKSIVEMAGLPKLKKI